MTAARAPRPEKRPHSLQGHGRTREDEFYWMRDENWQEVMRDPSLLRADIRAHLEAENAHTDRVLAPVEALRETVFREMKGRIKEDDSSVPAPDGPWLYWTRFETGGQHPIFVRAARPSNTDDPVTALMDDGDALAKADILLHGDRMAEAATEAGHGYFDLAGAGHSPDHRLMAYAVDLQGSELFTIRIRDLATGKDLPDTLTGTAGDFVWSRDSRAVVYVRRDANLRPSSVWCHRLGSDGDTDVCLYEETDSRFYVHVSESESRDRIFIESGDHDSSEVRMLDAGDPLAPAVLIAPRRPGHLYDVTHHGERLLIMTNQGDAEDFKIVAAPLDRPGEEHWQDVVPHERGRLMLGLAVFRNHAAWLERVDGLPRIVTATIRDGRFEDRSAIAFDEEAYDLSLIGSHEFDTTALRLRYASPTSPAQVIDVDMASGTRRVRKVQEVPSGHDPADYVTRRLQVAADDGALIPVTILHHKNHPPGAGTPALLYGYGSYGITIPAGFSVARLSLVDRGFLFAIAHIRGGMDRGYHWYTDGKLSNKTNTFTDFIRAGEALVEHGLTSRGRLIAQGGSAGGLLVGAAVNLAPDLFLGAIGEVPFVDVLTTICDADLPLTPPEWTEWGNPITDEAAFTTIAGYSPYDNVEAKAYPHILATAGLTDPRVTYWEPAKWVARLRDRRTDNGLTLLWTHMEAGHGGAAGRFDRLKETARVYAFAIGLAEGLLATPE
ncbi:MAG: S9 family peptidase [Alphaproteobacteria bacterium]